MAAKQVFNMADEKRAIVANLTLFLSLSPLLAAFQCCGLMLGQLILAGSQITAINLQAAFCDLPEKSTLVVAPALARAFTCTKQTKSWPLY